ncbi:Rhodanese-related sulfurtransferase [Polaribacter irgensii 23-P]|uniref:Rhodanese-related sulfurtransferase n=1 Tax=Polaribacter irgensii 23-P TaxID=313594 RepID=A4C162_9FLAO|nr:sulfurtransferase [Polaribacter irgensii]EAR11865.1 Rhodanese-related sulfurtransferase [Polaribacter irgensii 23-P]
MTELVSVNWLRTHLRDDNLILLDATLEINIQEKHAIQKNQTIPGARYFDINGKFSNKNASFPNTAPSKEQFEIECQKLGINQTSKIVIFDANGIYSSPRAWWLFRMMGYHTVSVLDGGLPEWIKKGFSLVPRALENYALGNFKALPNDDFIKSYQDIINNVNTRSFTVIDARSEGRFNGTEKEPRKHLKSGHIPNSVNIPYPLVLDEGKFRTTSELKEIFKTPCPDNKNIIYSCGSGLTACIVMLAGEILNKKGLHIYDGSWSEWAELQKLTENAE